MYTYVHTYIFIIIHNSDDDKLIKMACLSLMFMNIGTHINLRTFIKKLHVLMLLFA